MSNASLWGAATAWFDNSRASFASGKFMLPYKVNSDVRHTECIDISLLIVPSTYYNMPANTILRRDAHDLEMVVEIKPRIPYHLRVKNRTYPYSMRDRSFGAYWLDLAPEIYRQCVRNNNRSPTTVIDSESDLDVDYGMLMHLLSTIFSTQAFILNKRWKRTCNFANSIRPVLRDENDLSTGSRSTTGRRTVVRRSIQWRWSRICNNSKSTNGDDDAYEYTYYPNDEDNGQEAELETVKTSTTINTKRTSPHNNKFRLMTISQQHSWRQR
jgi:hypothetical protein